MSGKILRVNDHNKELLIFLFEAGLVVGSKLDVLEKRKFDNSMIVSVNNKNQTLSEKISKNIL